MDNELGRTPAIATSATTSLPAPGADAIPDGATVTNSPPIGSRFAIIQNSFPKPIGPFVMVGLEPMRFATDEHPMRGDRWRIRPEAWAESENRTMLITPLQRGHGPNQWCPAEEITDGFFEGKVQIPVATVDIAALPVTAGDPNPLSPDAGP